MSMDKINGSPLLQHGLLEGSRRKDPVETGTKQESTAADTPATGAAPASGDTAQISETAHRLMELRQAVDIGRTSIAAVPDVRADKVAEAKARLKTDFYNSSEVRDKMASGLAAVFEGMDKL